MKNLFMEAEMFESYYNGPRDNQFKKSTEYKEATEDLKAILDDFFPEYPSLSEVIILKIMLNKVRHLKVFKNMEELA